MRNVIVTGGSRGLGLGIAKRLAASGFRVIAIARKPDGRLSEAISEANDRPTGSICFVAADLGEIQGLPVG